MKYINVLPQGFVLKEIFITTGVIISLFFLALPAYRDYMRRDYYKAVVEATVPFKVAVGKCYRTLKMFKGCDAGTHSIPAAVKKPKGALASINVSDGIIMATPVVRDGILATDLYVLTPKIVNDELTWVPSGGGLNNGHTG